MKVSKIYTSSFAINGDMEAGLLARAAKDKGVSITREYLPMGKFNVNITKQVEKGLFFKRTSFDKHDNYFYVDLSYGDLYYIKRTGSLLGGMEFEKSDLVRRMVDYQNEVIVMAGQLYNSGSIPYDDLDQSIVQFLASEGLIEIYEPDSDQLTNFFRYYLEDDIIMHKHFVRPRFHLPNFGNRRYNIDAYLEVVDRIDDDYKKAPIRFSHERLYDVLGYLYGGSVTLREVTYMPVIMFSRRVPGERTEKTDLHYPVCPKGSKKAKHGFKTEEKLEPISFMTEMGASGSVPIEASTINFSSVADMEEVKEQIRQKIVYPLTQVKLSKVYGKKAGGSILFYGPPGCGKTYIVRATVGECGINFFNINTSDIMSGGGEAAAKNIHEAFSRASKNAPCILFFDEIDALSGRREEAKGGESRIVINQFLMEMDGVESLSGNVLVIGSTNVPWGIDPAIRRAGRFTDQIFIPPPDHAARSEIFKIHTRKRPVSPDVNYEKLAELTEGYSSADIKAVCDDALEVPWEESLRGSPLRKAEMTDFLTVLNTRKSTLTAWYRLAEREIQKSGEAELYESLSSFILTHAGGVEKAVRPDIKFSDVADLARAKEEINKTVVYPLKNPELAKKFGKEVGGGVLMYGPPGCGKTYVAKATAGECDASFFNVKITDIISGEPGESEKKLHAIFERASHNTPAIIFLDEIDALAGRREAGMGADKRLVNQFLTELDGFKSMKGVMVIGSTNAPWDLDPALRRAGRFTDQIYLPAPDNETRVGIFKIHTRDRPVSPDVDFGVLSSMTENYSSADIKAVCDHALEIPWEEAFHGGIERQANMADFVRTLKERKSSLPPWYLLAEKQIEGSGEKEFYKELISDINAYKQSLVPASVVADAVKSEREAFVTLQQSERMQKIRGLELKKRKIEDALSLARDSFKKGVLSEEECKKIIIDYQKQLIEIEIEIKYTGA
ncbi:MAG: AAA family ATPase [Candidatus Altiarchaeota archaeon]|nr:AAA family ATPase [Candidatus Altiarchaeota archaeon]